MKAIKLTVCAALALMLGACNANKSRSDANDAAAAAEVAIAQPDAIAAIEGTWNIDSIVFDGKTIIPANTNPGEAIYLKFDRDSLVYCVTGCNNISGGYTVDADSIRFTQMLRTQMACPNMEVEDAVAPMLDRVAYTVADGKLTIAPSATSAIYTTRGAK